MDFHLSLEKKIIKKSLKTAEISSFEVMFRNVIQVYNFTSMLNLGGLAILALKRALYLS